MIPDAKFRGKHIETKEWVYGAYFYNHVHKRAFIICVGIDDISPVAWIQEVIPESVGQYIGVPDEEGVEIYTGDIVVSDSDDGHQAVVVTFEMSYDEDIFFSGFSGDTLCDAPEYDEDEETHLKVIGNIHDGTERRVAK